MKIIDRLSAAEPCFSFEFFPPHTEQGVDSLFRTVLELAPLNPGYVSCTYPGSSTPTPDPEIARRRRLTIDLTRRIREESGIEAMAHLTCSAHSRDDLVQILDGLAEDGADNVLALRGDPPQGGGAFVQAEGGFEHGIELIRLIREGGYPFCVGAACYPEKHQESPDAELDLRHLKAKVDAGADFLISQLFFDNSRWFDFMRRVRAAGIEVPVIPGLMPIINREGIIRMTELSGAYLPEALRDELDSRGDDAEAAVQTGIAHTTAQALELLDSGVPGIHFFTLNKSRATREIVSAIRQHQGQR
ncbi:MAG TPA: methylenetetrahydrofolate reductase [NAD(P)H] [Candidatus Solibacter sp.]|jgi:methylenetetrahydrofolate reductase (NADPH)|nr:methylenetetrahydrofolate reductase [NAD(P)H] [Candidatus Solibacter sp.]